MILLSVLYGILFVVYILREYTFIKKKNKIEIISYVRIYYSLINGLLPCIVYFRYDMGDLAIISEIGTIEPTNIAIIFFCSIIGYIFLSIGYRTSFSNKWKNVSKKKISIDERKLFYLVFILMLVGYLSLFRWTMAYGSISNFMQHASSIRSGHGEFTNNYAFFKHFAKFVNFSFIIFGSYFIFSKIDRKLIKNKFMLSIFSLFSFVGAFAFLLCSDSRGTFGTAIIVIALSAVSFYSMKKKLLVRKQLLIIGMIAVVGFIITSMASNIANIYRYGEPILGNSDINIIDKFISEFNFIIQTQNKVIDVIFSSQYKWKLFDDILGSLIAWLPSFLKPFSDPETLWTYNTILIKGTSNTGILPTDMLSASFYLFFLFGPIFLPLFIGKTIKYVEEKIESINNIPYKIILKHLFALKFLMLVSHYMLRSKVYENMSLIVGIILVHYLCRRKNSTKRN